MNNYCALLIDDQDHIRECLKEFLENQEFTVFEASNGEDGLQIYKRKKPRLIITDFGMPIMNGHDVIKEIRRLDLETYIVLCTGLESVAANMVAYCDKILPKPFSPENLNSILQGFKESLASQTSQ